MAGRFTMDFITDLIEKAVKLTREEMKTPQYDPKRIPPGCKKPCGPDCGINHLMYNIAETFKNEMGPEFNSRDMFYFLDKCGWKVNQH